MTSLSPETQLAASKELLLALGRAHTRLPAEQQANLQEAIEYIERTEQFFGTPDDE